MTNRLDNVQTVLDRTDWQTLDKQRNAFRTFLTVLADESGRTPSTARKTTYQESLNGLANWLDALEAAARMDGYQTKEPTL